MREQKENVKTIGPYNDTYHDTYHDTRTQNPIRYGELLLELQEKGLSQGEIAEKLSCNRQMVGRYLRMGKWPREIKNYAQKNRAKITNTKLLNFVTKNLGPGEVLEEMRKITGEKEETRETIEFPNVAGFHDLIEKLELLEDRMDSLETAPTKPPEPKEPETKKSIPWDSIKEFLEAPAVICTVSCISFLTLYLVYQGYLFFFAIQPDKLTALSNAVISEVVPFLAAASLALATSRFRKIFSFTLLAATTSGLALFMHSSVSTQMNQGSGDFKRLEEQRTLVLESIESKKEVLATIPGNFVTKRQEIEKEITKERDQLAKVDKDLSAVESARWSVSDVGLGYAVWLRIAAMLLNAYLIHCLFSLYRTRI